jgi:hypothetical protein
MSTPASKSNRNWSWQDAIYGVMVLGSLAGLLYVLNASAGQ